jgi:ribosomal protein S18 acetylase RimI-like enzyme
MKDDTTLGQAITEGTFFVVGELGGRTVGYAYATSHFGGRLLHLVRIAVDPRKQGRGIGVRLLAEVIRFAQEQQAHIVTLNTQAYNTRAQRLYQWFGFTDSGERQPVMRYDLGL